MGSSNLRNPQTQHLGEGNEGVLLPRNLTVSPLNRGTLVNRRGKSTPGKGSERSSGGSSGDHRVATIKQHQESNLKPPTHAKNIRPCRL